MLLYLPDSIIAIIFGNLLGDLAAIRLSMACKRLRHIASEFVPATDDDFYNACERGQLLAIHNWIFREENGYSISIALNQSLKGANVATAKLMLGKMSSYNDQIVASVFESGDPATINLITTYIIKDSHQISWENALAGALRAGNYDLSIRLMDKYEVNYSHFADACSGGSMPLVWHVADKIKAVNWMAHIYEVCKSGNRDLYEYAISKGAKPCSLAIRGACECGNSELVELIIKTDKKLMQASEFNEVVKHFDSKTIIRIANLCEIDIDDYLSIICASGKADLINPRAFTSLGPAQQDRMIAISCAHPAVLRILLPLANPTSWNAIFIMIKYCHPDSARLLIKYEAISYACGLLSVTDWSILLSKANLPGNKPLAKIILSFYSPLDSHDLMWDASKRANLALLKIFANLGTKPNWKELLESAIANCCPDIAEFIIDKSMDLDWALQLAHDARSWRIVKLLLDRGARIWT